MQYEPWLKNIDKIL